MIFTSTKAIREAIKEELAASDKDTTKAADLKKEIVRLEIERDKKQEEWDRREREVEHKVGLERKRQEFEIEQAKKTTEVTIREENLKADKERFKAEMDFQRKHLESEIASLRTLVGQMLERLPSAHIMLDLERGKK